MALPPLPESPSIVHRARFSARAAGALDALLVMLPAQASGASLGSLPEAERWRGLHARAVPAAGSVRSTTLANAHQTRAVLGYLGAHASPFETLALAGRMLKEAAAPEVRTIALASAGGAPAESQSALLSAALAQAYPLPDFRSTRTRARTGIGRIELLGEAPPDLRFIRTAAQANNLARYFTALPANKLDAPTYRRAIGALARAHGLSMRWLDEPALRRLGAGAFLAVAAGNAERTAGIAHLRYRPARARRRTAPLALIGKGVLFDTGGNNLKPHRAMLEMHTDMAGSAVALAILVALAELRVPFPADAWLAISENRIGASAYRPQDVVRASNGTTIQVIHTDAEGRMLLADTLALAGRTGPRLMIDFGTLTGACVYALTERMSGVFTNEPRLTERLLAAGRASGERVWSFPFDADYDSDLESKVADVMQCATDGKGDHILAARFLGRFVPKGVPWVHLDLASAVRPGGLAHVNTDVTGFGVRYALQLLVRERLLDHLREAA